MQNQESWGGQGANFFCVFSGSNYFTGQRSSQGAHQRLGVRSNNSNSILLPAETSQLTAPYHKERIQHFVSVTTGHGKGIVGRETQACSAWKPTALSSSSFQFEFSALCLSPFPFPVCCLICHFNQILDLSLQILRFWWGGRGQTVDTWETDSPKASEQQLFILNAREKTHGSSHCLLASELCLSPSWPGRWTPVPLPPRQQHCQLLSCCHLTDFPSLRVKRRCCHPSPPSFWRRSSAPSPSHCYSSRASDFIFIPSK